MKKQKLLFITLLLFPICLIKISGQVPVETTPQPSILAPNIKIGNPGDNVLTPGVPSSSGRKSRQPSNMYERDRLETERRNTARQQIEENTPSSYKIQYELPSQAGMQGTEHYYQAAKELLDMLNGKKELNLKDAIFLVENAYFSGKLDRSKYEMSIINLVTIAQLKSKQEGYDWNNPITKNIMLFRAMADTLTIKLPFRENTEVSYPMQYDFEDFYGKKDYSKLFVSKLLATHSGQCHSLPLLYLILCETTGTEACLAFSPEHSYIKFKDSRNNWYNLELTQGRMVTDAFIIGSGFITTEAIKHGIYMKPQNRKQVIAHCLSDLASGYIHKYGYDKFAIQCADSVLKYAPENISALITKSNYYTFCFEYVVNQVGRPPKEVLKTHFPKVYELMENRNNFYRKMDEMGFKEIPKDAYEHWLRSVNEEKMKREHDFKYTKALQLIK